MYDAGLAARLDDIMAGMLEIDVTRMFGGYRFLMNGNMCTGIWNNQLVIRIGVADLGIYHAGGICRTAFRGAGPGIVPDAGGDVWH